MCVFCDLQGKRPYVYEDELVFAIKDAFPVSDGHTLIIPKRHAPTYFDATEDERRALAEAIVKVKTLLDASHHPDGYNLGVNCGEAAGQSVMHLHVHVIPRYLGDELRPRGGVRGVIASKNLTENTDRPKGGDPAWIS
ncbi:MAG: HIT family protein [Bacillus subtilis]|nr:HIT family protein [Bacillus subtilis]